MMSLYYSLGKPVRHGLPICSEDGGLPGPAGDYDVSPGDVQGPGAQEPESTS